MPTTTKAEIMKIIEKRGILFNTIDQNTITTGYEDLANDILEIVNAGKTYPDTAGWKHFPENISTYIAWKDFRINAYPEFSRSWEELRKK